MACIHFATDQPDVNSRPVSALNLANGQNWHQSRPETLVGQPSIWTDRRPDGSVDMRPSRRLVALPNWLVGSRCLNCGTCGSLTGALITPTADESDPNILCEACGYWRD